MSLDSSNASTGTPSFSTFPATKLKSNAGELLVQARSAPVLITNHGRKAAYLVSAELFDRLLELEDVLLLVMAEQALRGGMLSSAESMAYLKDLLNAGPANLKGPKKAARGAAAARTPARRATTARTAR